MTHAPMHGINRAVPEQFHVEAYHMEAQPRSLLREASELHEIPKMNYQSEIPKAYVVVVRLFAGLSLSVAVVDWCKRPR